jgi:hypothetical protein
MAAMKKTADLRALPAFGAKGKLRPQGVEFRRVKEL